MENEFSSNSLCSLSGTEFWKPLRELIAPVMTESSFQQARGMQVLWWVWLWAETRRGEESKQSKQFWPRCVCEGEWPGRMGVCHSHRFRPWEDLAEEQQGSGCAQACLIAQVQ